MFITGGRLPLTWHENSYVDMLPMTSMQLRPDDELGYPGRTYKFYNGSTVYPFGYGLSYTTYNYNLKATKRAINIKLNEFQHCRNLNYTDYAYRPPCPAVLVDDLKCDDHIEFEVQIDNIGTREGHEVVLVYDVPPEHIKGAPLKQLIAFKKVTVPAGESRTVKFDLNVCKSLQIVDYNAYQLLPSGEHTIVIGDGVTSFPIRVNFEN